MYSLFSFRKKKKKKDKEKEKEIFKQISSNTGGSGEEKQRTIVDKRTKAEIAADKAREERVRPVDTADMFVNELVRKTQT